MKGFLVWCFMGLIVGLILMIPFIYLTGKDDADIGVLFGFTGLVLASPILWKDI